MSRFVLAMMATLWAGAGMADEMGRLDYMQGCAGCHGESGMGHGPLAEFLTVDPPDLTTLAAENDGAFPMLEVIHAIDGRTELRAHGGPMPVWGAVFSRQVRDEGVMGGAEAITRGRILSIAYYLESIQK